MNEKEQYIYFDEYIKSLKGEYSQEELDEMRDMYHEAMQKGNVDWSEYATYKRIDIHPDPEGAKMGRPIWGSFEMESSRIITENQ